MTSNAVSERTHGRDTVGYASASEETEVGAEAEASVPTPGDSAQSVVSPPTPSPITIYTTVVSSPTPTPIHIYSTVTSTSPIHSVLVPFCDGITDTQLRSWARPHPTLIAQQAALVQSTMSAQARISRRMMSPPSPFNGQLITPTWIS